MKQQAKSQKYLSCSCQQLLKITPAPSDGAKQMRMTDSWSQWEFLLKRSFNITKCLQCVRGNEGKGKEKFAVKIWQMDKVTKSSEFWESLQTKPVEWKARGQMDFYFMRQEFGVCRLYFDKLLLADSNCFSLHYKCNYMMNRWALWTKCCMK